MNQNTPAGWYDAGDGSERYWDGVQWTENVRAAGAPSLDKPVADVALPPSSDVTQVAPRRVIDSGPVQPAPSSPGGYPPEQPQAYPPAQPQGYPAAGYPPANYPPAGGPGYPGAPGFAPGPGFPGQPSGGSKKPLIFGIVGAAVVLAIVAVVLVLTLGGDDDGDGGGDGDGGNGTGNRPEPTVEKFMAAVVADDCEAARELTTGSAREEIDCSDAGSEDAVDYDIGEAEVDGDEAKVPVNVLEPGGDYDLILTLTQEDGEWLISEIGEGSSAPTTGAPTIPTDPFPSEAFPSDFPS